MHPLLVANAAVSTWAAARLNARRVCLRAGIKTLSRPPRAPSAAPESPNTSRNPHSSQDVAILDVRGRVETATLEPGVEKSTYLSGYDDYLEGHIPVGA